MRLRRRPAISARRLGRSPLRLVLVMVLNRRRAQRKWNALMESDAGGIVHAFEDGAFEVAEAELDAERASAAVHDAPYESDEEGSLVAPPYGLLQHQVYGTLHFGGVLTDKPADRLACGREAHSSYRELAFWLLAERPRCKGCFAARERAET